MKVRRRLEELRLQKEQEGQREAEETRTKEGESAQSKVAELTERRDSLQQAIKPELKFEAKHLAMYDIAI